MIRSGTASFTALFMLAFVLATLLSVGPGCRDEPDMPAALGAHMLRQSFPEQASRVLQGQGDELVSIGQGFSVRSPAGQGTWRSLEAVLPREGTGAILLRAPEGFEVRVRELGVQGPGTVVEATVAYPREGGTSFWTAAPGGVEEWLHLEAGRADEAVVWEIEGASLRQRGESVELLDKDGVARLWVEAPAAFTRSGRPVTPRLQVREGQLSLSVDARGEEVLVDPLWTANAPMTIARRNHTATLLGDGRVLVVGGEGDNGSHSSAEFYNPASNSWAPAPSMSGARTTHSAEMLGNGKVLVIGAGAPELYDPATNAWTHGGTMVRGFSQRTSVVLQSGKVLVMGGWNNDVNADAELYDPATNTWSATAPMSVPRIHHTTTLLPNGKVLVAGGLDIFRIGGAGYGLNHASAELYDPVANTWTVAAPMATARASFTATLLQNGKVLVAGGSNDSGTLRAAELYDPTTDSWAPASSMSVARSIHTATLLPNGRVLVAAGGNNGSAGGDPSVTEMYDPATNAWLPGGTLTSGRAWHSATLLSSGKVLIAGGHRYYALSSTELFSLLPGDCSLDSECASGFCVDGVCCDSACGGGAPGDCQACNVAGAVGTCTPNLVGTLCREASTGLCEVAETCDGHSIVCPPEGPAPQGTVCRYRTEECDAVETCTGTSYDCPADIIAAAGTLCGDLDGPCDVRETCTGTSATCPADTFAPAGTSCRDSADLCDVEETCTGTSAACPSDTLAAAGTSCRAPEGLCDVEETCTGTSAACPADTVVDAGTLCRESMGLCDMEETCTGSAGNCPSDTFAAAGTSCREPASTCDATEMCTGASASCPADAAVSDGTSCSSGSCFAGTCRTADVMALAAGNAHSLALKSNGEVWAWGSDATGQLGNGSVLSSTATPGQVTALTGAIAVSAGGSHSLALLDNGEVWAWGSDGLGQLGDGGSSVNRQAPVKVIGLPDLAVSISAGREHSLAVLVDGTVWAWGRNTYGQLGVGGSTNRQSPALVMLPTQAVSVSAGGDHSLAMLADGTVWAWGRDLYGQLGNGGSATNSALPVQVVGLPDVAWSIAAGTDHSLALLVTGEVWSWGRDSSGQLGDGGGALNAQSPVRVINLPEPASAVSGGGSHSFALLTTGDVAVWGADTSGQLGDGAGVTSSQSPLVLTSFPGVFMIAAGTSHSLSLRTDTTAWAWGLDGTGQLGDNPAFTNRYVPVQTVMP